MRHYQPGRDDLLAAGLAAVETAHGRPPARVLDVGGGPGTTAEAVLRRWPDARVTVLDVDPALLALADTALPQVRTTRADISSPRWLQSAGGPYDLVLALMTLHYLPEDRIRDWYAEARHLLHPHGLLLVADAMPDAPATTPPQDNGDDPWTTWWSTLNEEPSTRSLLKERTARAQRPALSRIRRAGRLAPRDGPARPIQRRDGAPPRRQPRPHGVPPMSSSPPRGASATIAYYCDGHRCHAL
ncbi:class I SAM-dependent methyltransferase [Micromonospora sp. NBC_01655]|uniref:class I SAM-dependent methyltransferase n=1 Tax=Micromonospora sp. NBC_01655 TaxID=2975983 RepID=UPI00225BA03C|nr:class I SAM-dependent methyltransferase [Micromonospora sp. NBC_01655]MCX4471358.1 class I SAM-dependent methyltransferase [Micromonospora sp. NBC_01655]